MGRIGIFIILVIGSINARAQSSKLRSMVDSLQFINADTINCDADLYWRIVAHGKDAIPFLIDKLSDTTPTRLRYACKTGTLNVGEVAHFALIAIADFPAFSVTQLQFHVIIIDEQTGAACWSFYQWLFMNSNKKRYQDAMRKFYTREKDHYKKIALSVKDRSACQKKFGIHDFYSWKGL